MFLDLWSQPVRKTNRAGAKSGPQWPPGRRDPVCPCAVHFVAFMSEQLFLDLVGIGLPFHATTSQLHYCLWSWCRPPFNQTQLGPSKTRYLLKTNRGRGRSLPVTPVVSPSTLMSWQHVHRPILQKSLFSVKCCGLGPRDLMWNGLYREEKLCCTTCYLLPRRHLPPGSLTDTVFSIMLMFSWKTHLPWNREPGGNAATQAFGSFSWWWTPGFKEADKGFELLYPSLQALGKLMSNFFLALEPYPVEDVQQSFTFH